MSFHRPITLSSATAIASAGALITARRWRGAGIASAIGIVAIVVLFGDTSLKLFETWWTSPTYNHGLLIPLISAWLIAERQRELSAIAGEELISARADECDLVLLRDAFAEQPSRHRRFVGMRFVGSRPAIVSLLALDVAATLLGSYRALLPLIATALGASASARTAVGSLTISCTSDRRPCLTSSGASRS